MMRACCASLRPKKAVWGLTISNNFRTTVATPSKWPGLARPSQRSLRPLTATEVLNPAGYISSADGAKRTSTPRFARASRSASKVRGYFLRSSAGPNCFGFTKMDTTTGEHFRFASRTREKCPSCNAPIVGTKPIEHSLVSDSLATSFIQEIVRIVSMPGSGLGLCGTLAIKRDQVGADRFCLQLTQHRSDLAAMVAAVIHEVLKHLPERLGLRSPRHRLVMNDSL